MRTGNKNPGERLRAAGVRHVTKAQTALVMGPGAAPNAVSPHRAPPREYS